MQIVYSSLTIVGFYFFQLLIYSWFVVCVYRIPENNLPYCHKRPQVRMLLLSAFCIGVSVIWGVFRNEDQ